MSESENKTTIPLYNFEKVREVFKGLRLSVEKANRSGCYTLDEACVLKNSLDLVDQLANVTEKYQTIAQDNSKPKENETL